MGRGSTPRRASSWRRSGTPPAMPRRGCSTRRGAGSTRARPPRLCARTPGKRPPPSPRSPPRRCCRRAGSWFARRRGAGPAGRYGPAAMTIGLGTIAAALCAALLLSHALPEAPPKKVGADKLAAVEAGRHAARLVARPRRPAGRGRAAEPPRAAAPDSDPWPVFRSGAAFAAGPMIWSEDPCPCSTGERRLPRASGASRLSPIRTPSPGRRRGWRSRRSRPPKPRSRCRARRGSRCSAGWRWPSSTRSSSTGSSGRRPAPRSARGRAPPACPRADFLDGPALAILRHQTEADYHAWKAKETILARRAARTVLKSPVPPSSPPRREGCHRGETGSIVYGRNMRCDFRGLRENIAALFG